MARAATLPLAPRSVADFYARGHGDAARAGAAGQHLVDASRDSRRRSASRRTPCITRTIPSLANRFWRDPRPGRTACSPVRAASSSASAVPCISSGAASTWPSRDFPAGPRRAREGPAFMREAYSHEVISHGFWPGSGPILEPTFYAYAAPEPAGLKDAAVQPAAAGTIMRAWRVRPALRGGPRRPRHQTRRSPRSSTAPMSRPRRWRDGIVPRSSGPRSISGR